METFVISQLFIKLHKKIQEIVKEIIAAEFEESTRLNKVDESKAQVSIAT